MVMSDEWRNRPRTRVVGRTVVVELRGEIDMLTAPGISDHLDSLTTDQEPDVVIDLQQVEFIDCSGLSVLCRARRRIQERDGRLALVVTDPAITRTMRFAGLLGVFDVVDSDPTVPREV
ncbi:STAS domain-containing protein [Streptomyces lushanensis]|uniref:STAS domain-containing protein n=1 Tax=Streptomyces lushanensis TaxID=1434255 RepID=UPI00082F4705|nr:STAS domain-containing protein [Streptomyces lushanensis]